MIALCTSTSDTVCWHPSYIEGPISCGASVSGNTAGGEQFVGETSSDHFYSFTVANAGDLVTITTCGDGTHHDFDTVLRVYDETLTTELATNDDGVMAENGGHAACVMDVVYGNRYQSTLADLDLGPGNYILVVEGFEWREGSYTASMECDLVPSEPPTRDECLATAGDYYLEHDGYFWRTLDGAGPSGEYNPGNGCQCTDRSGWACTGGGNNYLPLPAGWVLAPNDATSIAVSGGQVISWSTSCVVLADGTSWNGADDTCGSNRLATSSGTYTVNFCNMRVLARCG